MLAMNKEELKFNCKSISNLFISQYLDKINKSDKFLLGFHTVDNKINYKETTSEKLSNDLYDAFLESKNKYKAIDIVVENNGLKTVLNTIDIRQ